MTVTYTFENGTVLDTPIRTIVGLTEEGHPVFEDWRDMGDPAAYYILTPCCFAIGQWGRVEGTTTCSVCARVVDDVHSEELWDDPSEFRPSLIEGLL